MPGGVSMPVKPSLDEPAIPLRLQRPLAAMWISLALHAALIALVQVAPPASSGLGEPVIEARLVSRHAEPPPLTPEVNTPAPPGEAVPLLAPSEAAEALPVAEPVAPSPPAEPVPAAAVAPTPASAPTASPSATAAPAPAAAITSSVDLTYYSAREVDVQARPLRDFDLKYPDAADRRRLSGKVVLQLKVEADGRVSNIEFVSATHPDLYDESKLKAILDVPFAPAQKNGRPVRELYQIEVGYDWEGRR